MTPPCVSYAKVGRGYVYMDLTLTTVKVELKRKVLMIKNDTENL